MAKVGSWNTTAANNNSAPPDGWPEGQAPSTVNDCAREMMAQIKTMVNNLEYIDLNNTPSFLTANSFSMATADTANFEVGRRVKLFDGGSTLYGYINSVSATFVQVQLDSGALDSSLSSVAMAVIKQSNNSLPENVYKKRNVVMNGSMDIWQRSASFAFGTGLISAFTADRFKYNQSATGAVNVSRLERSANASNVPSLALSGVLFNSSLGISVSATDVNANAGEYAAIFYSVEGYDWRQLAQRPVNLSFWARSNATGTYCVALRNNVDSSVVKEYSVSSPSTWKKYSLQFPKSPAAGTWDYSSGVGVVVSWALKAGSTFQAGANNWTATNVIATSNQTNFFASAGNTFAITGIQLEEGSYGTPLETTNYHDELQRCKRYFRNWTGGGVGHAYGADTIATSVPLIPEMRAAPTMLVANLNALMANANFAAAISISAIATIASFKDNILLKYTAVGGAGFVAGNAVAIYASNANPTIQLDSDL